MPIKPAMLIPPRKNRIPPNRTITTPTIRTRKTTTPGRLSRARCPIPEAINQAPVIWIINPIESINPAQRQSTNTRSKTASKT